MTPNDTLYPLPYRCSGLSFCGGPSIRQPHRSRGHGDAVSVSSHHSEEWELGRGRDPHRRLAGRAAGGLSWSQWQSIGGHPQRRAHAERRHGGGFRSVRGAEHGPPVEGFCHHYSRG